jgi:hypothetical protein
MLSLESKNPVAQRTLRDDLQISDAKVVGLSIERRLLHIAYAIHEQRLVGLVLVLLFLSSLLIWALNFEISRKPTLVLRAPSSLKQESQRLTRSPSVSYDQLAFFTLAVLPRLYTVDENGYPFLALLQGVVDPTIISRVELGFNQLGGDLKLNHMTQTLTLTAILDVVADEKLGRVAAYVKGYLCITLNASRVKFYPYRAQILLAVNPVGLLNPYPFYVLKCEEKIGAKALEWDLQHDNKRFLDL